ncbi:hypothetical protein FRC06_005868, partial [Ceratobasidium sp. 370]
MIDQYRKKLKNPNKKPSRAGRKKRKSTSPTIAALTPAHAGLSLEDKPVNQTPKHIASNDQPVHNEPTSGELFEDAPGASSSMLSPGDITVDLMTDSFSQMLIVPDSSVYANMLLDKHDDEDGVGFNISQVATPQKLPAPTRPLCASGAHKSIASTTSAGSAISKSLVANSASPPAAGGPVPGPTRKSIPPGLIAVDAASAPSTLSSGSEPAHPSAPPTSVTPIASTSLTASKSAHTPAPDSASPVPPSALDTPTSTPDTAPEDLSVCLTPDIVATLEKLAALPPGSRSRLPAKYQQI